MNVESEIQMTTKSFHSQNRKVDHVGYDNEETENINRSGKFKLHVGSKILMETKQSHTDKIKKVIHVDDENGET